MDLVRYRILGTTQALRPDGTNFRATFFSPEQIDEGMPRWVKLFDEIFR